MAVMSRAKRGSVWGVILLNIVMLPQKRIIRYIRSVAWIAFTGGIDLEDWELVIKAANWLQISEFQIFKNAYFEHFGNKTAKAVQKTASFHFVEYIKYGDFKIPYWVRDYCRKVVRRD